MDTAEGIARRHARYLSFVQVSHSLRCCSLADTNVYRVHDSNVFSFVCDALTANGGGMPKESQCANAMCGSAVSDGRGSGAVRGDSLACERREPAGRAESERERESKLDVQAGCEGEEQKELNAFSACLLNGFDGASAALALEVTALLEHLIRVAQLVSLNLARVSSRHLHAALLHQQRLVFQRL